jgi:hypothetical protein
LFFGCSGFSFQRGAAHNAASEVLRRQGIDLAFQGDSLLRTSGSPSCFGPGQDVLQAGKTFIRQRPDHSNERVVAGLEHTVPNRLCDRFTLCDLGFLTRAPIDWHEQCAGLGFI